MCSVREKVDLWASTHTIPPSRNMVVLWLAVVLVIRVGPTAIGLQPLPISLTMVPYYLARLSTGGLVIASILVAAGICWPHRRVGLSVEVAGYFLMAWASAFYGAALALGVAPPSASAIASGLTFGLAIGSMAQSIVIWLYVRGEKLRAESLSGEEIKGGL